MFSCTVSSSATAATAATAATIAATAATAATIAAVGNTSAARTCAKCHSISRRGTLHCCLTFTDSTMSTRRHVTAAQREKLFSIIGSANPDVVCLSEALVPIALATRAGELCKLSALAEDPDNRIEQPYLACAEFEKKKLQEYEGAPKVSGWWHAGRFQLLTSLCSSTLAHCSLNFCSNGCIA